MKISIVEGALDTGRIPIDNAIRMRCIVDAHPNDVTYQWYMNDEMLIGATFSDLVTIFDSLSFNFSDNSKDEKKLKKFHKMLSHQPLML